MSCFWATLRFDKLSDGYILWNQEELRFLSPITVYLAPYISLCDLLYNFIEDRVPYS